MSKVILETERMILRVMEPDDFEALAQILSDAETMRYYPRPFSATEVRDGIARNITRNELYGGGLWAMILKESGLLAGDCGLVFQSVDGDWELEIGYHVNRKYQGQGLATEAARACRDYGFRHFAISRLISLIRPENLPSRRVAEKNGLRIMKETMRADLLHYVYAIERQAV